MTLDNCPQCGAALPAVHDGHCPACRFPLGSSTPAEQPIPVESTVIPELSPEAAQIAASREWHANMRSLTPHVWVTYVLVALNVLVFLWMLVAGAKPFNPSVETLIEWGANFAPSTFNGEQWRLLTAAFLHSGVAHIAFNMFCLFGVGIATERMVGSTGFLVLYLVSALAGSLASAAWAPGIVSVGASGAVFGAFGAFFAACSRTDGTIPKLALDASRVAMAKLLAINFAFGFFVPNIDMAAHVGGLVAGFMCGLLLGQPLRPESLPQRRVRNVLLLVIAVPAIGVGTVVVGSQVASSDIVELQRVGEDEQRILNVFTDAVTRVQAGKLTDDELLVILDRDVIAPWAELRKKVDHAKDGRGLNTERLKRIGAYYAAREEAFVLFRKAVATNDPAVFSQSQEKMREVNRLLAALNKENSGGR